MVGRLYVAEDGGRLYVADGGWEVWDKYVAEDGWEVLSM